MVAELTQMVVPAYLDPGSGSIIFQAVVGGIMVVSLAAKTYWRRLRGLFQRNRSE